MINYLQKHKPIQKLRLFIVKNVSVSIIRRCALKHAAFDRAPVHKVFYTARELEIPISDPACVMGVEAHLDARIGHENFRMMPCSFGKMADGVDHHQRSLPPPGAVDASEAPLAVAPVAQDAREPRLNGGGIICFQCAHAMA